MRFLWLSCDFGGEFLVHAGRDVNIFRNFQRCGLAVPVPACGAAVALELHALNGQRTNARESAEVAAITSKS